MRFPEIRYSFRETKTARAEISEPRRSACVFRIRHVVNSTSPSVVYGIGCGYSVADIVEFVKGCASAKCKVQRRDWCSATFARETVRLSDGKTGDARSAGSPADGLRLTALRGVAFGDGFLYGTDAASPIGERCRLRRRFLSYASNAGGLAHVRSSAARKQTAEIPDQVRNDGMGVNAIMRGCVDAMQESPAATIFVLFLAPLKGEPSRVLFFMSFVQ